MAQILKSTDLWACPKCFGTITEDEYCTLPRKFETIRGESFTTVICPICKRKTIGIKWKRAIVRDLSQQKLPITF